MSIEASLQPSKVQQLAKAPTDNVVARGSLVQRTNVVAKGSLKRLQEHHKVSIGTSLDGRSMIPINLKYKPFKENDLENRLETAYRNIVKWIQETDENAHDVNIRISRDPNAPSRTVISITWRDASGEEKGLPHREILKTFIAELTQIEHIIRPSHYPTARQALAIPNGAPLPNVLAGLSEKEAQKASDKMVTIDEIHKKFSDQFTVFYQKKKKEFQDREHLPHLSLKQKREDLETLSRLFQKLQSTNRHALLWAASRYPDEPREDNIANTADKITLQLKDAIRQANKVSKFKSYFMSPKWNEEEIHTYAMDVGDLVLTSDLQKNCQDRTQRGFTQSSIEAFVMQMSHHDVKDLVDTHPFTKDLTKETKQELTTLIQHVVARPQAQ